MQTKNMLINILLCTTVEKFGVSMIKKKKKEINTFIQKGHIRLIKTWW